MQCRVNAELHLNKSTAADAVLEELRPVLGICQTVFINEPYPSLPAQGLNQMNTTGARPLTHWAPQTDV
jgi:hypothetical protein